MSFMTKKVLIVSSYCFNNASANGICAQALREAFNDKNIETHLLGIGDAGVLLRNEYVIPEMTKKGATISKIGAFKRLIKSFFIPIQDKQMIDSYYTIIKRLHKEHNFDVIVAMFFPLEIVTAVARLKKEVNDFSFVIYELDSVADGIGGDKKSIFKLLSSKSNVRWCEKNYKLADVICVLKGHEEHAKRVYGKAFGDKIKIVDIPLLKDNFMLNAPAGSDIVKFVYSGELNSVYRPADRLLDVFDKKRSFENWHLHFFTKGNCESYLKGRAKFDDRIHCHGYVSQDVLRKHFETTDCLISIGNTHSNSVPSKIINYISLGKPIIHFCLQDNDICETYLNKYPLALIIQKNESIEAASKQVVEFVQNTIGKTMEFDQVCKLFPMNLSSYSVDIVMESI